MEITGAEVIPGIREIELAGLKAWPGVEVDHDGSWLRRAACGYTKRANSVQCLDPGDGDDVVPRIAASRRWLETRGLAATFSDHAAQCPGADRGAGRGGVEAIRP